MHSKLDNSADNALSDLQDTLLSPMEEALFKGWASANNIDKPDDPNDHVDYRGIYKMTGGQVMPHGELARMAKTVNSERTLMNVLKERMQDASDAAKDSVEKEKDRAFQDKQNKFKLQHAVHKTRHMELGNKGKQIELQGKPYDLQAKDKDNEAKRIDLEGKFITGLMGNNNAQSKPAGTTSGQKSSK